MLARYPRRCSYGWLRRCGEFLLAGRWPPVTRAARELRKSDAKRPFFSASGWAGGHCRKFVTHVGRTSGCAQKGYLPQGGNPYNEPATGIVVTNSVKIGCLEFGELDKVPVRCDHDPTSDVTADSAITVGDRPWSAARPGGNRHLDGP